MKSVLLLAIALAIPGMTAAQDQPLSIMSGSAGSTTFRIAQDIAEVGKTCGLTLQAVESPGSLANLIAVNDRDRTPMALVQQDFLDYLRTYETVDRRIPGNIAEIGVIAPLFGQEVHVITTTEITSLDQLEGKRVAMGEAESGTFLTAHVMLDLVDAQPAERLLLPTDAALARLRSGLLDAVFLVDGAPSGQIAAAGLDPLKVHLLPLDAPALVAAYPAATIAAGTYGFTPEDVSVLSVGTVLIGFDFAADSTRDYSRTVCNVIAETAHILASQVEALQAIGHPKWSSLDISTPVDDWPVIACATRGLDPAFQSDCPAP